MAKKKREAREMIEAKRERARPRTGYVMVQLTPAEREKLEGIRERMEIDLGIKVALAEVFRSFLRLAE